MVVLSGLYESSGTSYEINIRAALQDFWFDKFWDWGAGGRFGRQAAKAAPAAKPAAAAAPAEEKPKKPLSSFFVSSHNFLHSFPVAENSPKVPSILLPKTRCARTPPPHTRTPEFLISSIRTIGPAGLSLHPSLLRPPNSAQHPHAHLPPPPRDPSKPHPLPPPAPSSPPSPPLHKPTPHRSPARGLRAAARHFGPASRPLAEP